MKRLIIKFFLCLFPLLLVNCSNSIRKKSYGHTVAGEADIVVVSENKFYENEINQVIKVEIKNTSSQTQRYESLRGSIILVEAYDTHHNKLFRKFFSLHNLDQISTGNNFSLNPNQIKEFSIPIYLSGQKIFEAKEILCKIFFLFLPQEYKRTSLSLKFKHLK